MPAHRLPWFHFWSEAVEHEKLADLSDTDRWTWICCLAKANQQSRRWRFKSVKHAAQVTGRPPESIEALIPVGLLDQTAEGLLIHDAKKWNDASGFSRPEREYWPNVGRTLATDEEEDIDTEPGLTPPDPPKAAKKAAKGQPCSADELAELIRFWTPRLPQEALDRCVAAAGELTRASAAYLNDRIFSEAERRHAVVQPSVTRLPAHGRRYGQADH